jgi:hypothetical protein
MTATDDLSCQDLVELVNDYLEELLDCHVRVRFEAHLAACPPCRTYVDQMRLTIAVTGRIDPAELSASARLSLLEAFRSWAGGEDPADRVTGAAAEPW